MSVGIGLTKFVVGGVASSSAGFVAARVVKNLMGPLEELSKWNKIRAVVGVSVISGAVGVAAANYTDKTIDDVYEQAKVWNAMFDQFGQAHAEDKANATVLTEEDLEERRETDEEASE